MFMVLTIGAIQTNETIEIDVSAQIAGDDIYTFAIRSLYSDAARYSSKEGPVPAELLLEFGGESEPSSYPVISEFTPSAGVAGSEVTLTGSNFRQVSAVRFNGTASGSFLILSDAEIRAMVPQLATTGRITISSSDGVANSDRDFTVQDAVGRFSFSPVEDTFVRSAKPSKTYGGSDELRVRHPHSSSTIAFLKFKVDGISGSVSRARIRLHVLDASADGGAIYSVSNNYRDSNELWEENGMTWSNFPRVNGAALDNMEAVTKGGLVEFDVSVAVLGNGMVSFAISNLANDAAKYSSKEGPVAPELVVETGSLAKMNTLSSETKDETIMTTETAETTMLPETIGLQSNYPNPFNPETTIRYALPEASNVKLRIFNVRGQLIRTLLDGQQEAGFQTVRWSGRNDNGQSVSSGIYFLRLETGGKMFTQRLMLQK